MSLVWNSILFTPCLRLCIARFFVLALFVLLHYNSHLAWKGLEAIFLYRDLNKLKYAGFIFVWFNLNFLCFSVFYLESTN